MTNPCYNEVYYIEALLLFYVNCQQAYDSQEMASLIFSISKTLLSHGHVISNNVAF